MEQKIYTRSVMRMGREPEHSLIVTIPRKICGALQIEKGTRLYFKLEENRFVVSKEIKSLENVTENRNDSTVTVNSSDQTKKERGDITVQGISLVDLRY
jgi:antitoxin component of MazEF toxin-antitoxin module